MLETNTLAQAEQIRKETTHLYLMSLLRAEGMPIFTDYGRETGRVTHYRIVNG